MNRLARLAVLGLCCLAVACAPMWTRIDQPEARVNGQGDAFTVVAPVGWVHMSGYTGSLRLTRDGPQVQFIEVALEAPEEALAHARKDPRLPANVLPSELATLVLAELRASSLLANAAVVENVPARVAGTSGFRLRLDFRNSRGARFDRVVYGCQQGNKLLLFRSEERR